MGDPEPRESVDTDPELELNNRIDKEIEKLTFYLEDTDEMINSCDFEKMKMTSERTSQINARLNSLILELQELKLDLGKYTARAIRQWKKDTKDRYSMLLDNRDRMVRRLEEENKREIQIAEAEKYKLKFEQEERLHREVQQREKELWEERLQAEIRVAEKKLEIESAAKASGSKLPELKITPFKGTAEDWIRFENMFISQVDNKKISAEEKFGYLLELVEPRVRDHLSNLKPGEVGYKIAWERLREEYGQTKTVVAAHVDQILNLPILKSGGHAKVREFYETLSKSHDALETLGEGNMLRGLALSTLNKLQKIRADLVRTDEGWESWEMGDVIKALQKWLKRNKPAEESEREPGDKRKERHYFNQKGVSPQTPKGRCIFGCQEAHWGDLCPIYDTLEKRRKFFSENRLCFNCGRTGHRENKCNGRGCYKCKARHHTSLCHDKQHNAMLSGFTPTSDEKTLPAIIPVVIKGQTFWAYLDTGSGRNFVSREVIRKLNLRSVRHESRHIVTVNGVKKQSMPVFEIEMNSVDGKARENLEVTGSQMVDFTTIKRPTIAELKAKHAHMRDKSFYRTASEEYPIHVILSDAFYCKIRTEQIIKGQPDDPVVEGTTFGWVVHGGKEYADGRCMFVRETNDYERLYALDVLGIEDRSETDQSDVYSEFRENISRTDDGRYEVSVPWVPGAKLENTNEEPSRKRLRNVERKLRNDVELREAYEKIVRDQLHEGIIETVIDKSRGDRIFYMPHKPVVRANAQTTKVRMVFDASCKPHPLANSVNECMHTGPPLQPLMWDIMIRARMAPHLILGDLEKAFLQIAIKEEDRDAFRFLFNINDKEEHFRFARVPFDAEASPFMLGATIHHHLDRQPTELTNTVNALRENTYVDNLMQTGNDVDELKEFREEATRIFESAKFPAHKWESDLQELDTEPNPSKILGHVWDKREDILEIQADVSAQEKDPVTKRAILSKLSGVYDPLGIISPTTVEGKRIYRDACEEKRGWNDEVSESTKKAWFKWTGQLRNVKIPRSLVRDLRRVKTIHLHVFADASNVACSAVMIAIVEDTTGVVKGLLTSKSRISKRNTSIPRLELVSGHMAANMVKNVCAALKRWPITSVTVWMDSLVALYWICNPGRQWKTFVSNRVRKIAEITNETPITWKHCPTERNIADLGSRGATIEKMERGEWFAGPDWLLKEEEWPEQPQLQTTKAVKEEHKPVESSMLVLKRKPDEWDDLLQRNSYWKTLRVTAWAQRFRANALAKMRKENKRKGPPTTDDIAQAEVCWVKRVQKYVQPDLQSPGWEVIKDEQRGVLKCKGRISGYEPIYVDDRAFVDKLVQHVHHQVSHLGVANTMSEIREKWWIPKLRSRVKKVINECNLCKVFRAKPYGPSPTADLPSFRVEGGRPFETVGVDFAGPLDYKLAKNGKGKCYIIIFTCAWSRAVHLEVTKSQTAEEFQRELNAFITRRTRPVRIVSDNASVFKATATWIKKIRKSEVL
ncbi:uncharacterized protein LOC116604510 [Nematostella vectensis]|uniref:uncharacterized protein LOC116604510 n=1 Tax=Nematostella vectensis TaxID=45351 RepID=UPI0020776503|nr:uncharacterized protein LOC116604510 [Nematostella vectensis]